MFQLLLDSHYLLFTTILTALIISLTFHEYGHGITAKWFGDNTAEKMGRLTLNPLPHIDPVGLMMIIFIGFGFAKPVPTNPNNYTSRLAIPLVAAAGPAMNLVIAIVAINLYKLGLESGWTLFQGEGAQFFFTYLALINLLLMMFNLLPIGPLDGHYILPYFLPHKFAKSYIKHNLQYGTYALLGLILLSFLGVPIFQYLFQFGQHLLQLIIFV